MNGAHRQFLAGPAFPAHENGPVSGSILSHEGKSGLHPIRNPNHVLKTICLPDLIFQLLHPLLEGSHLNGPPNQGKQRIVVEGLLQVVERPFLHCVDR